MPAPRQTEDRPLRTGLPKSKPSKSSEKQNSPSTARRPSEPVHYARWLGDDLELLWMIDLAPSKVRGLVQFIAAGEICQKRAPAGAPIPRLVEVLRRRGFDIVRIDCDACPNTKKHSLWYVAAFPFRPDFADLPVQPDLSDFRDREVEE